ncbi:MAG: hypothetical protein ACOCVG_02090 [Verrucomicrobiota bacterium]
MDPAAMTIPTQERSFVIPELRLLLEVCGFTADHIGGGTAENWGIRPLSLDEYELLAIGHKRV